MRLRKRILYLVTAAILAVAVGIGSLLAGIAVVDAARLRNEHPASHPDNPAISFIVYTSQETSTDEPPGDGDPRPGWGIGEIIAIIIASILLVIIIPLTVIYCRKLWLM